MATELHDDVCNNLLALEMNIRTISTEEGADLNKQLDLLNNTRERLRKLSHELMPPVFSMLHSMNCLLTMFCTYHCQKVRMRNIILR